VSLQSRSMIVDGKVWGTVYTFEHAGDVFDVHTHTDADNHVTILANGSVCVLGKHEGIVLAAKPGGTIINWKAGEPHGFAALTDGATLINIIKNR